MYAEAYVQNDVHHQDPVELVRLLYSKAIAKLGEALGHLAAGRIPERSMAVAHASSVILELQGSLDAEHGGEIAASLARLYDYMQERLALANAQQLSEPLEECRDLLSTLLEGWRACNTELEAEPEAGAAPPAVEPEAADAGRAWTL